MTEKENSNQENKKRGFIVVGIIALIVLVGGFFYYGYCKTHISTDDAFIDGNIHTIASKIHGAIKEIPVTDNQFVKKGDLLVVIDPEDYSVRFREATSALDAEKARLGETERRIAAAFAQLELQQANLKLASMEKNRAENLFKDEVIARDQYDKTMTTFEVAKAQVRTAEEQFRSVESQKMSQVSTIRQKEASAAMAGLNYKYTKIHAPVDGFVSKRTVRVGNQIQPGQPLMAVVGNNELWITANFKETQLENIRPGQTVEISVDSYSGKTFKGTVESIMAGTGVVFSTFPSENATGNYVKVVQRIPVKIILDKETDKEHVLRLGMSVIPTVLTK